MSIKSIRQFLVAAFLVSALAACTPIQAPATTATAEPAATAAATEEEATAEEATAEPMPIEGVDAETCDALQAALSEKLGQELTKQEGSPCTLTASGTGEDFGNFVDVAQSIRDVLEADGWTEDQTTMADGPTGTASSYFKDLTVAAVSVDWEPSDEAECPADQPISECDLEPSQQIFTIVIDLVQIA